MNRKNINFVLDRLRVAESHLCNSDLRQIQPKEALRITRQCIEFLEEMRKNEPKLG